MFRRFAEGFERPQPDQLRDWFLGEMVTYDGTIIHDEAYIILREFLADPDASISATQLAKRVFMDPFQTRSLCRQLTTHKILVETPAFSTNFRIARERMSDKFYERLQAQMKPIRRAA